jgi:hypothetical protein
VVGSDMDNTKPDFRDGLSELTEGNPGSHNNNGVLPCPLG